jgi:hypothetical protein
MEPKAENVVQNVGAIAETISVFYNSIARQVPKDVALELTKHFMDITVTRRTTKTLDPRALAAALAEAQKRAEAQRKKQSSQPPQAAPDPQSPPTQGTEDTK